MHLMRASVLKAFLAQSGVNGRVSRTQYRPCLQAHVLISMKPSLSNRLRAEIPDVMADKRESSIEREDTTCVQSVVSDQRDIWAECGGLSKLINQY